MYCGWEEDEGEQAADDWEEVDGSAAVEAAVDPPMFASWAIGDWWRMPNEVIGGRDPDIEWDCGDNTDDNEEEHWPEVS